MPARRRCSRRTGRECSRDTLQINFNLIKTNLKRTMISANLRRPPPPRRRTRQGPREFEENRNKVPGRKIIKQLFYILLTGLVLDSQSSLSEAAPAGANFDQLARFFKTMQKSVSDGQMIKLECNEDYVIDVSAALHSVSGDPMRAPQSEQCNSTQPLLPSPLGPEETKALVRSNCQGLASCKLDLRWPGSGGGATEATNGSVSEQARKLRKMILGLSGSGNEASKGAGCAGGSRMLLEIVYKCRANKMKSRNVCRNNKLQLECPVDKQILVISADYGGWPNETRFNEKCGPQSNGSTSRPTPPTPELCHANQAATTAALTSRCMHKRLCSLDVRPDILGEPNCAPGQPEFLKVVYICASETYLIPVTGPPVATAPTAVENLEVVEAGGEEQLGDYQKESKQVLASSSGEQSANLLWSGWHNSLLGSNTKLTLQIQKYSPLLGAASGLTFVIFVLVKISQHLASRGPAGKSSSGRGNGNSKGKCSIGGQEGRHSSSSSSKNSSSCSTASGVTGSDAFLIKYLPTTNSCSSSGGSTSSAASTAQCHSMRAAGGGVTGSANREALMFMGGQKKQTSSSKHNSCSESCFSLDDYNQTHQQLNGQSSAANSPGLMINEEPANELNHRQAFATARPRLWSIYGNEQRHQQAPYYNHTMRPTRTFLGQPAAAASAAAVCPQHQNPPGDQLLMALASNQHQFQHQQQQHQLPQQHQNNQADWFRQPAQASPVERLALLLQQQRRQQAEQLDSANQCAFHQQLVFPPPAVQLELPQVNHHHHHHEQLNQQQLNQQPNQQPNQQAPGMRQFQANSEGQLAAAAAATTAPPINVIPSCDN